MKNAVDELLDSLTAPLPDHFWVVSTSDIMYRVTEKVARQIMADLDAAGEKNNVQIKFVDILGGQCVTVSGSIRNFYESTPELRRRDGEWDKILKAEKGFD